VLWVSELNDALRPAGKCHPWRHASGAGCSSRVAGSVRSRRGALYYSFPLIAERMGQDLGLSKPEVYGAATIVDTAAPS
jgi:hypothetical protein